MTRPQIIKIADSLSLALNPFLLLPLIYLIALFVTDFPTQTIQSRWLACVLVGNIIVPFWWIFYLDQRGVVLDDTLANPTLHRQRLIALVPIAAILSAEILIMLITGKHEPLFAIFLTSVAISLASGVISYYWKISAHATGISATLTYLIVLVGPGALWGLIIVPLLAWARVVLHRHTFMQFLIGLLLPPAIIILIFRYLGL